MPTYTPPLRDMQFVMHEVLKVTDEFKTMPKHADADSLYFMPMCATCWAGTTYVGQADPPGRVLFWAAL